MHAARPGSDGNPVSPASRGLLPGLFLAVAVAFAVLAVNRHWLLPSLDATGVRYLAATPQLAAGALPAIPIAPWDADNGASGLDGRGTLMPIVMAALMSAGGARAYVVGLWVLAGAAALAVLALAWTVGGAAGAGGAALAGGLVALAPFTLDAATSLQPSLLLGALTAVMIGTMAYQPRWHAAHGFLAALAWLAHPAGVGAVAAAVVWPAAQPHRGRWRGRALLAAAPAAVLLALGARWPLLAPPTSSPSLRALGDALNELAGAAVPFARGGWTTTTAPILLASVGALAVAEARATPEPPAAPHWSEPAAMDLLAMRFRRATGVVALASLVATAWGGRVPGSWLPAAFLVLALGAAVSVRWKRRLRGPLGWVPLVLLLLWGTAAAWTSRARLVELRAEGRGATASVWVESPVIRWIDNRSRPYAEIYATDPALVLVQSGRGARTLPAEGEELAAFARHFSAHPGAVVLTRPHDGEARARELTTLLGLREVVRVDEGRILVPADSLP